MTTPNLYVPGTFAVRTPTTTGQQVHGGGRRVPRQAVLDPSWLAEFNRGTARAIAANASGVRERYCDGIVRRESS